MPLEDFLTGAFVYLAAAVVAAPLFARLGLGSVLGYLIAGVVIGPSVLGLTGQGVDDVLHFAEFGVIVMLFLVGLELQPAKLWELRKPILGLGTAQVALTAALIGINRRGEAFEFGRDDALEVEEAVEAERERRVLEKLTPKLATAVSRRTTVPVTERGDVNEPFYELVSAISGNGGLYGVL